MEDIENLRKLRSAKDRFASYSLFDFNTAAFFKCKLTIILPAMKVKKKYTIGK